MKNAEVTSNQNCRGAGALELGIICPIFLMLVFGIIEVGRGMMVSNLVTNAAREGAKMAVRDGSTNADVTSSVQAFMNSALGTAASKMTVSITTIPAAGHPDAGDTVANCQRGDLITVTVQVPFNSVALIPGDYLAGRQLVGQSAMRRE